MLQAGRWIGFLALVTTLCLWAVLLFANPYGSEGISRDTYAAGAVMMALAFWLLVPWANWVDRHRESGRSPVS